MQLEVKDQAGCGTLVDMAGLGFVGGSEVVFQRLWSAGDGVSDTATSHPGLVATSSFRGTLSGCANLVEHICLIFRSFALRVFSSYHE